MTNYDKILEILNERTGSDCTEAWKAIWERNWIYFTSQMGNYDCPSERRTAEEECSAKAEKLNQVSLFKQVDDILKDLPLYNAAYHHMHEEHSATAEIKELIQQVKSSPIPVESTISMDGLDEYFLNEANITITSESAFRCNSDVKTLTYTPCKE